MRKSYIKRLNNYSDKISYWWVEAMELSIHIETRRNLGQLKEADVLEKRYKDMKKKSYSWYLKSIDLIEKMTEREYYSSYYYKQQIMTFEEAKGE